MHIPKRRHAHLLTTASALSMGLRGAAWAHLKALLDDVQRIVSATLHMLLTLRRRVQRWHPNLQALASASVTAVSRACP